MIVGFSKYGKGKGSGPVNYLTGARNPDGTERDPQPEVLRGDPALVRQLIDSLDFKWKYTSGVLSFAPGEVITPEMETAIMDEFERVAFAGLGWDRYSILWVRHTHADHHELNFVVPRVELASGKSLNIRPPGPAAKNLFDTFRSMVNARYGLADPDDPTRAQVVSLPNHIEKIQAQAKRTGNTLKDDIREVITEHVKREVLAGRITDRAGIVAYLEAEGLPVQRQGKEYLSVDDPQSGARIRLKGGLYSVEQFDTVRGKLERETEQNDRPKPERAAQFAEQLEPLVEARAQFNLERYGADERDDLPHGREVSQEPLGDYIVRHLGGDALSEVWRGYRQEMLEAADMPRGQAPSGAPSAQQEKEQEWWERYYGRDIER